MAQER